MDAQTLPIRRFRCISPFDTEAASPHGRSWPVSVARMVFMALACSASPVWGQTVPLGTSGNFGVLAGSAVSNTGPSVVNGNVGVWSGTAITGFPPGSIFAGSGFFHSGDQVAQLAQSDLSIALTDAASRVCGTTIAGGLLGDLTLAPGVYCMGTGSLTGILRLNGPGVYIFKVTEAFTTAADASVALLSGASACDVFWEVGSSATIGGNSMMAGNLLALVSITLNTGAGLSGRALAGSGAVTLDSNNITTCLSDVIFANGFE